MSRGSCASALPLPAVAFGAARIFHVNLNCSSLERSRAFYVEATGLIEGVRTAPETPQPGAAFGLDRAWWAAWILIGTRAFEGGAIDLLEWREPAPSGTPPRHYHQCGFQRVGIRVPDLDAVIGRLAARGGAAWSEPIIHVAGDRRIRLVHASDPDGIALELIEGGGPDLSFVSVVCADLERSIAWYEALGFQVHARFPSESADGSRLRVPGRVAAEEVMLVPGGGGSVRLLLVGFRAPAAIPPEKRTLSTLGIARTALLVPDLDACVAKLDRLGIALLSAPVAMAMGPGLPELRFVCFPGPDGEILELIERPDPGT
jgi:catechol 2,3-dioxygenase-like lactoylglutathione lyase family enzyme